jgi:hypothetical protein
MYEVVPRTKEHLPMPPTLTSNELRLGILGRAQRDSKVELCHFVDMNSHGHNLVVSKEEEDLCNFYMELNKKTTDATKALLGLRSLSLWEHRVGVPKILTLKDAIERVVYLYCNPSKAALCETIDDYPGVNSWKAFLTAEPAVDAQVEIEAHWYPVAAIPRIPRSRALSRRQDEELCIKMKQSAKRQKHTIIVKPFKWLEVFGITKPEKIESIRQDIIRRVREAEAEYRSKRAQAGKRAFKPAELQKEAYMRHHVSVKQGKKIVVICSDSVLRAQELARYRYIVKVCRDNYAKAKAGVRVEWPPGTFTPWFPPGFVFPNS